MCICVNVFAMSDKFLIIYLIDKWLHSVGMQGVGKIAVSTERNIPNGMPDFPNFASPIDITK
jgi:hypothetical protein